MYTIERKDYYKICIYLLIACYIIVEGICIYAYIAYPPQRLCTTDSFIFLLFCIILILYYLIKYFRKDLNFTVLRIDDNGIYLCPKKNEGVFIPWEKIRYVTFIEDYNYSKMTNLDYDGLVEFKKKYAIEGINSEECEEDPSGISDEWGSSNNPPSPNCVTIHNITNYQGDVILELTNSINGTDSVSVTRGDTVQYRTLIKNTGTVATFNVLVKTIVPEELEYIKNSANFGGVYDPDTRIVTWDISKLDAGTEAELKYRATVATDVADLGSIQLRSVATSDEYPNEIDSGEVTIEVQKKSTAFVENATEVIRNPKTGSIISMILCVLSIGIVFTLNYRYQKKHLD